jgi:hypothetical protein
MRNYRESTSRIRIRLWEMDSAEISNILRGIHRNKIKWRTSSEDIKAKKSMFTSGLSIAWSPREIPKKEQRLKSK